MSYYKTEIIDSKDFDSYFLDHIRKNMNDDVATRILLEYFDGFTAANAYSFDDDGRYVRSVSNMKRSTFVVASTENTVKISTLNLVVEKNDLRIVIDYNYEIDQRDLLLFYTVLHYMETSLNEEQKKILSTLDGIFDSFDKSETSGYIDVKFEYRYHDGSFKANIDFNSGWIKK